MFAALILVALVESAAAAASHSPHVLFVDHTQLASIDASLELRMQPPVKGPRVLWPTEPWESWAVFAYNSVVAGDKSATPPRPHRMYYDCIEGTGQPPGGRQLAGQRPDAISKRRICLAVSDDGLTWTKPKLGIFSVNISGVLSTANNILLEDSGNGVFHDPSDSEFPWKMVCSAAAYKSKDGLRWLKLPFHLPVEEDDTKPTAYYDPRLKKYVVSVRRDCTWDSKTFPCKWIAGHTPSGLVRPLATRYVGRCVTSNLSNWQQDDPDGGGCAVVFGPDEKDPTEVDIYTNAWTPYPSIENPSLHLYFPSMYHHFSSKVPFGFGNDGLLDLRLVVSRDGAHLNYTQSRNGRSPYVPLGDNHCGGAAHAPSNGADAAGAAGALRAVVLLVLLLLLTFPSLSPVGGWCSPKSGVESNHTDADTSAMYMASGYVPSSDAWESSDSLYFYASAQPFTHGGDAGSHLWGNNSGIRLLTARRDGFVAVEAPYEFASSIEQQPSLTTVELAVPSNCPPPRAHSIPSPHSSSTACSYDFPQNKCPNSIPTATCKTDADCNAPHVPEPGCCSCGGVRPTCVSGVCVSKGAKRKGFTSSDLCWTGKPASSNITVISGGVELYVNMQTSVVGWVAVEVVGQPSFALVNADKLKGGAIDAVASWQRGESASLSALAGKKVQLKVAMADAKLYSLRLGCAKP